MRIGNGGERAAGTLQDKAMDSCPVLAGEKRRREKKRHLSLFLSPPLYDFTVKINDGFDNT